jgi:CBS domain-containing protein
MLQVFMEETAHPRGRGRKAWELRKVRKEWEWEGEEMSIERYCQRKVSTARPGDTAKSAAERMDKDGVGCLVVVEAGRPVGILTDRELALQVLCRRLDPGAIRVKDLASPRVETISKHAGFQDATWKIRRSGLRRLPVVDKRGKLFGIISSDDLMQVAVGEFAHLGEALRAQLPAEQSAQREE